MRPIAPRLPWPERNVAADQLQYAELVVATVEHDDGSKALVTRWRLTAADIALLQSGQDLFVSQLNFGGPMTPLSVTIGPGNYGPTDD